MIHNGFGPCHTLDLSMAERFENVGYEGSGRPGIEFIAAENSPWKGFNIVLHTRLIVHT